MLVHFNGPETVFDKLEMSCGILNPTVGPGGYGFVRIIDETSVVDMIVG